MSAEQPMSDDDAMAAEWAAALAESKPSTDSGGMSGALQAETVAPASFTNFAPTDGMTGAGNDINMILDIPVQLTVELGRTRIPIKHILQLAQGSVVELDALAGEPMDVLVNGFLILCEADVPPETVIDKVRRVDLVGDREAPLVEDLLEDAPGGRLVPFLRRRCGRLAVGRPGELGRSCRLRGCLVISAEHTEQDDRR